MGAFIAVCLFLAIVYGIKKVNSHMGNGWGEALSLGFVGWVMIGIVAVVVALLAYATSVIWLPLLVIGLVIYLVFKMAAPKKEKILVYKGTQSQPIGFVSAPSGRRVLKHEKVQNDSMRKLYELIYVENSDGSRSIISRVSDFMWHVKGGMFGTIEINEDTLTTIYEETVSVTGLSEAVNDVYVTYPGLLTKAQVNMLIGAKDPSYASSSS